MSDEYNQENKPLEAQSSETMSGTPSKDIDYVRHLMILIKFLRVYLFLNEARRLQLKYHLFHLGHPSLFQRDCRQ